MTLRVEPWQVWWVRLGPVVGTEQDGHRPAVVVGSDDHCRFPIELALIVPLTTTDRGLPHHVRIDSDTSGLPVTSWALTESLRSVSTRRFIGDHPAGVLSPGEQAGISRWVHRMLA